jgi:hypothetical protein
LLGYRLQHLLLLSLLVRLHWLRWVHGFVPFAWGLHCTTTVRPQVVLLLFLLPPLLLSASPIGLSHATAVLHSLLLLLHWCLVLIMLLLLLLLLHRDLLLLMLVASPARLFLRAVLQLQLRQFGVHMLL